jgi:hypothetical protein
MSPTNCGRNDLVARISWHPLRRAEKRRAGRARPKPPPPQPFGASAFAFRSMLSKVSGSTPSAMCSGDVVVSAAGENVGDLVMGGKETLNLPRRLEPLHDPLPSSGRLMGVLSPVIEAFVLPVLGDEHTRCSTLLLEELAEQAFGGLLVTPALDENIKNETVLIDGTPKPMLLPSKADDDLIEVPFVATARRSSPDAVGDSRPNLRLHCRIVSCVTDMPRAASISSTHAQAQREPKTKPYRVADDLSGVAVAGVNRIARRRHSARLSDQPGSYQACSRPT